VLLRYRFQSNRARGRFLADQDWFLGGLGVRFLNGTGAGSEQGGEKTSGEKT